MIVMVVVAVVVVVEWMTEGIFLNGAVISLFSSIFMQYHKIGWISFKQKS